MAFYDIFNIFKERPVTGQTPGQPVVTPAHNPASLRGTMMAKDVGVVGPGQVAPGLQIVGQPAAPQPQPTPQATSVAQPQAQVAAPPYNPAVAQMLAAPVSTEPTSAFQVSRLLDIMGQKVRDTNNLAQTRAKLVTHLLDRPLTEEEIISLPKPIQDAVRSGDRKTVEFQTRLLNDQIQGRTQSLDSSVKFLADAYTKEIEQAEQRKQQALKTVSDFVAAYGPDAGTALRTMYGDNYLNQLRQYGINVEALSAAGLPYTTKERADLGLGAASTYRTDRHNNPTAFTTAVAKQAGLVEGVDYTQGDPFTGSDGRTYYTARLTGDPIAQTVKVIDRLGVYTPDGRPRWNYIERIPEAKNWKNLTYDQKANVIRQMYQFEGGTSLFGDRTDDEALKAAQAIMAGTGTLASISTKNNLQGRTAQVLAKLKEEALKSGDIYGTMAASAGGKELDATSVLAFEKGANVLYQLADLQNNIKKEATGPIWGTIRSKNPYDEKAQTIKAQLAAIVPNLARGVYGEVGVLTDNDIANYSKTLPNLKSTEGVRNAVLGITLKSVQRSLEQKIKTQAAAGRDVSGFTDLYRNIAKVADETLKNVGITPTEEATRTVQPPTPKNLQADYQEYLKMIGG